MSEAVIDAKTRIVNTALDVVAGKPPACAESTCRPCHRVDLQFLVVTPSVIPKAHEKALQEAGYAWMDAFDIEFSSLKREATMPVARISRAGYFYLYYEDRHRWDVWQVMENGLTRKIIHQVDIAQYSKRQSAFIDDPKPKACSQGAKNHAAHLICIEGASSIEKVWLAYSARLWAPKVLQHYADNPEVRLPGPDGKPGPKKKLRTVRGRELKPRAIVAGSTPGDGCLPLTKESLARHVADYVDHTSPAYHRAFADALRPLDDARFGQAEAFAKRVRAIERASGPAKNPTLYVGKSLVVMVPDDIGVIEQHNHLRLTAKEARQAWAAGGPDFTGKNDNPLRAWQLASSLHEETIEAWIVGGYVQRRKDARAQGRPTLIPPMNGRIITADEYRDRREWETRNGKPNEPPDVTYERLPGPVERYRVIWSQKYIDQDLENYGRDLAKQRIARYRNKLRQEGTDGVIKFRQDFKASVEAWEKHIAGIDADFVGWLVHHRLAVALRNDFDRKINLLKPNPEHGTPAQQVADVMARIEATDKAWGGGAVSPVSTRELAKAYGMDPDAPAKWIDDALLEPYSYAKAIVDDKGKQKDVAEKINGLVNEIPEKYKEAIHAQHKMHAEAISSLSHASQQAAQLQTALIDAERAKSLGLAAVSLEQAKRGLTMHVRTAVIMDLITNPVAEHYVTIAVKVPTGEALDKAAEVFQEGRLEMDIETKTDTTRQVRRRSTMRLRKLTGRPGLTQPEFYTVAVTEKRLMEMEKQAMRAGEEVVEVIADDALGKSLPQAFKLPKSTALNLIGEQASAAKASMQAIWSRQTAVVGVLGLIQLRALLDALDKLDTKEGYEHTDTLMTVFTSAAGLIEGGTAVVSGYYDIRTQGTHLVLARTAMRAAAVRLAGGVVGAAGMAFDGVASYAKYKSAKNRNSREAMWAFQASMVAFGLSAATLTASTGLGFANATVARFAASRAVITRLGGAVAAELVGSSLTGIGIVLGIGGFALLLYGESLEDDLIDIFLKRSYWGKGEASAAKFGYGAQTTDVGAKPLLRWAEQGLKEERNGFSALSVGFKALLQWHHYKGRSSILHARIETADSNDKRRLGYDLTVTGANGTSVTGLSNRDVPFVFEAEEGRYVAEVKLPIGPADWAAAKSAHFEYNVYEEFEQVSIAREVLEVEKKSE
jgi:hypothetical protein